MSIDPSPSDPRSVLALEPQRRLSVDDYHRMIAAGVFDEDEHIELLEGVIVEMSPQRPRHAEVIRRLCDPRFVTAGPDHVVQAQLPLSLGEASEPEPDVAVVPRRPWQWELFRWRMQQMAVGRSASRHHAAACLV